MLVLENIKNIFKKQFNKNTISIKELDIGNFLELEYKDPKTIGIINSNTLTCTRLNQDELTNRKIKGFVTSKQFDNNLRIWFIGFRSCKKNGNEMLERNFLFLETEIEKIKLLQ